MKIGKQKNEFCEIRHKEARPNGLLHQDLCRTGAAVVLTFCQNPTGKSVIHGLAILLDGERGPSTEKDPAAGVLTTQLALFLLSASY